MDRAKESDEFGEKFFCGKQNFVREMRRIYKELEAFRQDLSEQLEGG